MCMTVRQFEYTAAPRYQSWVLRRSVSPWGRDHGVFDLILRALTRTHISFHRWRNSTDFFASAKAGRHLRGPQRANEHNLKLPQCRGVRNCVGGANELTPGCDSPSVAVVPLTELTLSPLMVTVRMHGHLYGNGRD